MSGLAELQRDFMRALFSAHPPAAAGLAVYRSSVLANLVAALEVAYPVARRLVGDAFFAEAARRYALAHASPSGDLGDYGEGFAAFLAAYPHAAALAYLPDVARLEWACHECERAPDAAPFDFAALARVPEEEYGELRFVLHPAVRLLRSAHPVCAIHAANAPGRDGVPARVEGSEFALVRRVDGHARVESISAHEWRLLERLARGETLAAASAGVPPQILAGGPAGYVAGGVVCGFTAPRCAP